MVVSCNQFADTIFHFGHLHYFRAQHVGKRLLWLLAKHRHYAIYKTTNFEYLVTLYMLTSYLVMTTVRP